MREIERERERERERVRVRVREKERERKREREKEREAHKSLTQKSMTYRDTVYLKRRYKIIHNNQFFNLK